MTAMITPSLGIHAEGVRKAKILMGCDTLESTLSFFLQDLGFRVDAIYPVDNPSTAMISGHGLSIRLTMADYTMTLPNAVLEPQRDFNGQRFS